MSRRVLSFRAIAALLLSIGLLVLGGINIRQKRLWIPPEDGVAWVSREGGVEAKYVDPEGAGFRAGLLAGDRVRSIQGRPVLKETEVPQALYQFGVWSKVRYELERAGQNFAVDVVLAPPTERVLRQRVILEFVGILYFAVGAFVVLRRSRVPYASHFYWVCLTSFVLYTFHSTGKLNAFDWTVFWSDVTAYLLLPPMFLHFCLRFPTENRWFEARRWMFLVLYLPGAALLTVWVLFVLGVVQSAPSAVEFRDAIDNLSDIHLGIMSLAAAAVLFRTSRSVEAPELRQQMKWVTRGTVAAVVPFFFLATVPRVLGVAGAPLADLSVLALGLIPIAFGYAIHRYRLMDVDLLFKAGVAYTLATASVLGLYATIVVLAGEILGSGLPVGTAARIAATIVAALLFTPIKDTIQLWLDKFFFRERFGLRQTLNSFGRTLSSETDERRLHDRIVDRLSRSLLVSRVAIFVEDHSQAGRFRPVRSVGITIPDGADLEFLSTVTRESHLFFETERFGIHYFVPCRVKDRVIAFLGLGRTDNGDYLTSEDLELLETVSDYAAIALENARLYRSLEQRAVEYQQLKDFSENIVESINVGVIVEDLDHRIVGWNSALEQMTRRRREEVRGRHTADVLPPEFFYPLFENRFVFKKQWGDLIVNLSATPLLDKEGAPRGNLIIVDDVTDRVRLEDQLVQNEKLTSIGLLAAGVAHEVNTPLAVISNYSQILRKEMSPDDMRVRLLDKITSQTFRASEIVNSLLNFSRTSATEFTDVDLHQVLNDTVSLLEHQLRKGRIRVEYRLQAESPVTSGNAGKLQQVFLNLVLNARDAMPDGGVLEVETEGRGSTIEISIKDTGTGIQPDHLKKIYDPFFTTKAIGKGTGLGLAVAYGIVQEHGGHIAVESRVGAGTCFRLELPLVRKAVNV